MPAQPGLYRPPTPPIEDATTSTLNDLLRQVVARFAEIEARSTLVTTNSDAEEIMFDIELDGWRYLLIRTAVPSNCLVQLSPREREIVRMVAEGHPNKVIAAVLNISSWTVGTHLRRIFAKLGVGSRAAMVARCPEIGRAAAACDSGLTHRSRPTSQPAGMR